MSFDREVLEAVGTSVRERGAMMPRKRLADNAAEQIAQSADELEATARLVRATDKTLALTLLRQAIDLRRSARHVAQQAKRRCREKHQRIALQKEREWNHAPRTPKPEWWEN